jgi:hypothetical protein
MLSKDITTLMQPQWVNICHRTLLTDLGTMPSMQLTPCSRALLKSLIHTQLIKKFHALHKSPRFITMFTATGPFLSQMNLVHILKAYFFEICFNIILQLHLHLLPKWSLPFKFSEKLCMQFSSLASMLHHIWHSFDNTNTGEKYKLWSPVCTSLQPITFSLSGSNILHSTLLSKTVSICILILRWETKFDTHTKQQV